MAIKSFKDFCFESAIQYFKSELPLGKYWKRKDVQSDIFKNLLSSLSLKIIVLSVVSFKQIAI